MGPAGARPPSELLSYSPETDTIWFDAGVGQSSQWAELQALWLVVANEAPPLFA